MPAVARLRAAVGTRLRRRQALYEAAERAMTVVEPSIDRLEAALDRQQQEVAALRSAVSDLHELQTKQIRLSRAAYDEIGRLRRQLVAVRQSDAYAATFEHRRPLISVPIATYNAAELLVERAIASVRGQTYEEWEIMVVGDGCTDDTAAWVEGLGDRRIRFANLPFRTVTPEAAQDRWLVSGAAPWNRAVELCRGEWIAPLDDDDEFLPNHMETLLDLAHESRAEFVYGKLETVGHPTDPYLFTFPPKLHVIGMQAAMYLRALSFFECDIYSWAVEEPTDWNLIRRMRDAGVLMAATDVPVARYYPSLGSRA
jgi:Glycosyl transferase family 2